MFIVNSPYWLGNYYYYYNMEGTSCDICFGVYTEKTCIPKRLECGHSVCFSCLESILQDQKWCPTCRMALSKSLKDYPTNFSILKAATSLNKNGSISSDDLDILSLKNAKSLLLSTNETLSKSIEKKCLFRNEILSNIEKIEKLVLKERDDNTTDEPKELIAEIEDHLEKVNKDLNCNPDVKNFLLLNDYKSEKHYLYDIVVRLLNGKIIYSREMIGNLGWKYGQITYDGDRLHIHCLVSSTVKQDILIVLLQDMRKCIKSTDDIKPFLWVGSEEKILFTLVDNPSFLPLQLIKFCTGEAGQVLKGSDAKVGEFIPDNNSQPAQFVSDSSNLNCCRFYIPTEPIGCDYNHALMKRYGTNVRKDDIVLYLCKNGITIQDTVLLCSENGITIHKISSDFSINNNMVAKLHRESEINFGNLEGKEIIDCGISFAF